MVVELDQHFLTNEIVLENIILNSKINSKDIIFEIGTGKGVLTKKLLLSNAQKIISTEIDQKLKLELEDLSKNPKLNLIFESGLKEIQNHVFTKLIANIPYAITEPLYKKILDLKIPFCILLHGIDFYKNIELRDTKWKYFVKSLYDIELIQEVSGDSFMPSTKVKSSLVKLTIKDDSKKSNKDLFFTKLWEKRDRKLQNSVIFSLVDSLLLTKTQAKEKLNSIKIDSTILNKKLDNLSNDEFNRFIFGVSKIF